MKLISVNRLDLTGKEFCVWIKLFFSSNSHHFTIDLTRTPNTSNRESGYNLIKLK